MYEIGGKQIPATLAEVVDPKRSALLIWDMEYAIGPNAFNYKEILANLKMLSGAARQSGVPVFYSVQTGFDLLKEEAGVWVRVRMKRAKASDPKQLLNEKENPRDREIVEMLRSNGVRTILIGGVATEGGIEGTARSARNLGYDTVVLKDCVGSRNHELHELALKLMEQTHFDIAAAAEIAAIWQRK